MSSSSSSSRSWRFILWIFVLLACAGLPASAISKCKACDEKVAAAEISGESKCSTPGEGSCVGHDPASCFALYDKDNNKLIRMGCTDQKTSGCEKEITEEGRYCYCDKNDECIPDPPPKGSSGSGSFTKPLPLFTLVWVGVGLVCMFKGM